MRRIAKASLAILLLLSLIIATVAVAANYHGNAKTKVFHSPGCRYYNCNDCTVVLSSREEAVSQGFRACKVCKP